MARKLAIGNFVAFAVSLALANAVTGRAETFKFRMRADRVSSEELLKVVKDENLPVQSFLATKITGWEGQTLLLEENGEPSPFSPEALQDMLEVPGVASVIFKAYIDEVSARAKN